MTEQLDRAKVAELFSLFSDLEEEGLAPWAPLWERACRAVEARLRPDADLQSGMQALCAAAAGCAYADYLLVRADSAGQGPVQVGDIALGSAGSGRDAAEIRAHFLAGAAHLLLPSCPTLRAVEEPV